MNGERGLSSSVKVNALCCRSGWVPFIEKTCAKGSVRRILVANVDLMAKTLENRHQFIAMPTRTRPIDKFATAAAKCSKEVFISCN